VPMAGAWELGAFFNSEPPYVGSYSAEVNECGQEVLVLGGHVQVSGPAQFACRPADPARDAMAALVILGLLAAQAGVEGLQAGGATIVGHEDQDGVVAQAGLAQGGFEPGEVFVNVSDHAEE